MSEGVRELCLVLRGETEDDEMQTVELTVARGEDPLAIGDWVSFPHDGEWSRGQIVAVEHQWQQIMDMFSWARAYHVAKVRKVT